MHSCSDVMQSELAIVNQVLPVVRQMNLCGSGGWPGRLDGDIRLQNSQRALGVVQTLDLIDVVAVVVRHRGVVVVSHPS